MTVDPDTTRGLYAKYAVRKLMPMTDQRGEQTTVEAPVTDRVFVLNPARDPHAVDALWAYARSCRHTYPKLSEDLLAWVNEIRTRHPEDPVDEICQARYHGLDKQLRGSACRLNRGHAGEHVSHQNRGFLA